MGYFILTCTRVVVKQKSNNIFVKINNMKGNFYDASQSLCLMEIVPLRRLFGKISQNNWFVCSVTYRFFKTFY